MQRAGQTLPCQAPSRPSCLPTRPSLNRRCNTSLADQRPRIGALHLWVRIRSGVQVGPSQRAVLGIGVQKQHPPGVCQSGGQVGGQSGLPDPALLVDYGDHRHGRVPTAVPHHPYSHAPYHQSTGARHRVRTAVDGILSARVRMVRRSRPWHSGLRSPGPADPAPSSRLPQGRIRG